MKIQELAIIFVIIILPISILLSEYTQFQIQTIKTQTEYDAKLTTATYDAIKAFQLNAQNETYSDLANQRVQNIETSVNSFRNSIMSGFKLNGYTEEELNNYIPALVYTLYDGLYIYSPYENTNYRYEYETDSSTGEIKKDRYTGEPIYAKDEEGNKIPAEENGENIYGLKPYISYSCRYKKGNIDVVITYALDNYIKVQGMIGNEYVNKAGYLIDNIIVTDQGVSYNGVKIEAEQLKENVGGNTYQYVKRNGTKYYWVGNQIVYISNGIVKIQCSEGDSSYTQWVNLINNNTYAQQYYKDAEEFTKWFKSTNLVNLTYNDAYDEVINEYTGETNIQQIWLNDSRQIFVDGENNIENELSNFNQHRLAVIRHKIETNLAIAISNYNSYSNAKNVFQMQQLKEDEWEQITHNISVISFLQGLPIGGKIYNGYTIVTNSESEEVVLEQNIYILGKDRNYHKIGDNNLEVDDSGVYGSKISTGRLNIDFKRTTLTNSEGYQTLYYYPLKAYNASYNSIVMQNDVTTYDDIYKYVNTQNDDLKKAFYTALGRERVSQYKSSDIEGQPTYIPKGYKHVEGTTMENGYVVADRKGNQYVWIEVPRTSTVYPTAGLNITSFTNAEFTKIENDLKLYTSVYRNNTDFMDENHPKTGLTDAQYNTQKKKMLKSIYQNGGFYVGRYETGTDYNDPNGHRNAPGDTIQKPVIKQNAYPYTYVTVAQSQQLSQSFATDGYSTSLMFGVQWDLILKYLETKGTTQAELITDSTSWGNYAGSSFTITNPNSKYNRWNNGAYGEKESGTPVSLTTGSSEIFNKQNIYDLAGNAWEWTLENSLVYNRVCVRRGGEWNSPHDEYVSFRGYDSGETLYLSRGFRVSLYRDEGI